MRLAKSTILKKRIKRGFSIVEVAFTVTVFTLVFSAIVGSGYLLYNGFNRVKSNAVRLQEMGKFLETVTADVYSVDIYPRYAGEQFVFEEKLLAFTVMGSPVEYSEEGGSFKIKRGKERVEYKFIENFSVKYFDDNDFEIMEDEFPHYCVMSFTFYNKKTVSITVKL